jgi:hypothetical protein
MAIGGIWDGGAASLQIGLSLVNRDRPAAQLHSAVSVLFTRCNLLIGLSHPLIIIGHKKWGHI